MRKMIALGAGGALLAAGAAGMTVRSASAETLVENSAEFRFQLDFHVNDAALQRMLPAGWEAAVATQGPAKDANLRIIFIDRVDVTNPDGTPKTSDALVYIAIPVKQTGTSNAGQMILGGLVSDPKQAPGAFGNYMHATTAKVTRTYSSSNGRPLTSENGTPLTSENGARLTSDANAIMGEETWEFAAANGERIETHLKYQRGSGRRNPTSDTKFFNPSNPGAYQIFRVDSGLDIMKNASVPVADHHVGEFSYNASGGNLGTLFDGSERVLSWDSFHWYNRGIYNP